MTSIRILGPVEASVNGRSLRLAGRRQLTLFSFLVLHANQAVSNDSLSDAVWGPSRGGTGNRLQMAIARLRRVLEDSSPDTAGLVLRTVGGGYMLSVPTGELDAEVFAVLVRDGCSELDAGRPAKAAELLSSALALWRGPPLAEVAFEDFARARSGVSRSSGLLRSKRSSMRSCNLAGTQGLSASLRLSSPSSPHASASPRC